MYGHTFGLVEPRLKYSAFLQRLPDCGGVNLPEISPSRLCGAYPVWRRPLISDSDR